MDDLRLVFIITPVPYNRNLAAIFFIQGADVRLVEINHCNRKLKHKKGELQCVDCCLFYNVEKIPTAYRQRRKSNFGHFV